MTTEDRLLDSCERMWQLLRKSPMNADVLGHRLRLTRVQVLHRLKIIGAVPAGEGVARVYKLPEGKEWIS